MIGFQLASFCFICAMVTYLEIQEYALITDDNAAQYGLSTNFGIYDFAQSENKL